MGPDLLLAHTRIRLYIDAIRNKDKREYAEQYYRNVIRNGLPDGERPIGLSFMGAQAVRLQIAEIMKGKA